MTAEFVLPRSVTPYTVLVSTFDPNKDRAFAFRTAYCRAGPRVAGADPPIALVDAPME